MVLPTLDLVEWSVTGSLCQGSVLMKRAKRLRSNMLRNADHPL